MPPPKQAKGNTGVSARKRQQRKLAAYVIGVMLLYILVMTVYEAHFAGMFVPDIEIDESGRSRVRRRPFRHKQRLDPDKATTPEDAVLEGFLTLVELSVPSDGLVGASADNRYKASATFCMIDWKLQQQNPANVPMFRDLKAKSSMCEGTIVTMDLFDAVQHAKVYDAKFANVTNTQNKNDMVLYASPPAGVVFHETRCGSTLTANLLASVSNARVYSESPPPLAAFKACDLHPCNPNFHTQLIQDVFYMMGRSAKPPQKQNSQNPSPPKVFYKIQSIGSMSIDKFTAAFPEAPWVYLYRDSIEVMQSHWKGRGESSSAWSGGGGTPVCARNFVNPNQPATTLQILQSKHKTIKDVSKMEYCAAHLAALSLSAIQENARTGKGRFVNYQQLPEAVWEKILPIDMGMSVDAETIGRMNTVSGLYSKGKGNKANTEWKEDSAKKQSTASKELTAASDFFLHDTYEQLEALSRQS